MVRLSPSQEAQDTRHPGDYKGEVEFWVSREVMVQLVFCHVVIPHGFHAQRKEKHVLTHK